MESNKPALPPGHFWTKETEDSIFKNVPPPDPQPTERKITWVGFRIVKKVCGGGYEPLLLNLEHLSSVEGVLIPGRTGKHVKVVMRTGDRFYCAGKPEDFLEESK